MAVEIQLPLGQMPEAEVSLRLAFHLLNLPRSDGSATVALDGAHAKVHGNEVFPVARFLETHGWVQEDQDGKNDWQGTYKKNGKSLRITCQSGIGDVAATVAGRTIRAECKKGPLVRKPGSPEYPLVREGIGQLMTVKVVGSNDVLVVAVPWTDAFRRLQEVWADRPLMARTGIKIVLVRRDGAVGGLDLSQEDATAVPETGI